MPSPYELALRGAAAKRVESGTLIASLGPTDSVVLVDLDDLAAHTAGDLAQLTLLVGGGLVEGRDTKVKNGALH
jgi:hypothetical protein